MTDFEKRRSVISDMTFAGDYEVVYPAELPGGARESRVFYYPMPSECTGQDGLLLKVCPFRAPNWIGVFAFGDLYRLGLNGIYAHPNRKSLCIVSNSCGYIVRVDDPSQWEQIPFTPVLDARVLPNKNRLILVSHTGLIAYGPNGIAWRHPWLFDDELSVEEINIETVVVTGWVGVKASIMTLSIDIETGNLLEDCC